MSVDRIRPTWLHDDHPDDAGTVAGLAPNDPRIVGLEGALRSEGIERGDAVTWRIPNGPDAIALLWACWRIGAIAVPVHHRATDTENAAMVGSLPIRRTVEAEEIPRLIERGANSSARSTDVDPRDVALVLHTSGSSGSPKAVMHTQAGLADKARRMALLHGLGPADVVLMPAPLAHISGVLNGVTVPAAANMRSVLMDRWDPDRALALIESERVTFMVGPPTFFTDLMASERFTTHRVASLRLISAGGTGIDAAFCEEASRRLGAVVKRSYGSTEAPTVTTSAPGDPTPQGWSTDGRPSGATRLRIAATGELEVRGPELFVGYTDVGRNADAVTGDGWFRTGDLAAIDADGWLTVTGRLGELIIRGGENVTPAEVEAVLLSHPMIDAAVVVGVPDARLGQRIATAIVGKWDRVRIAFEMTERPRP